MMKSLKKLVGGLIVATLFVGNPFVAPAVQAAGWCKPAPALDTYATYTPAVSYSGGGTAGYYEMNPYTAGAGNQYKIRLSVFKGSTLKYQMKSVNSPFGKAGSQKEFASSSSNLATYMNTDFISSYNMPYSAVISKGRMIYAPPAGSIGSTNGSTRVIGWAKSTYSEAAGFSLAAPLTSGALSATVAGVNLKTMPANSIVAYTPKSATKTIARGAFAILVSNKKVVMSYLRGTNIRPTFGVLFQATGTAVAKLKKFTNGKAALYKMPPLTKTSIVADTVAPTGYVAFGTNKIYIKAINFMGPNNAGATMYDSNFGGTQTAGAASFMVDNAGIVKTIWASKGARITIDPAKYPGQRIFQVNLAQKALVSKLVLGQKVTVVERFSSVEKNNIVEATGRGSLLLVNGTNVEDCVGVSEDQRPRSVVGWNESGDFWVATSTMGMHYQDNMYRLGGSTIHQMGEWLKSLGATQAVSFDGGGSTAQFITRSGSVSRLDLPESEWIRDIPTGLLFEPVG